uniref:DDE-1 domain-containing protein n=1 Tax=Clastoptera arizonana TaxID=38151 RepID=A0A1B6C1Z8_9HEMI
MVCSNASVSHKLKLLVIGKSKKPRSFKGTRAENLPVHYFNKKKGWIDQQIFKEWFEKKCIPEVKEHLRSKNLPRKTILLIGNAPSQPGENVLRSESGNFIVKFLPPNVTSLIQPMDQGVIASMKKKVQNVLTEKTN